MKLAVFTVAVGRRWCQRAMALYESLRAVGAYQGDFWVFADHRLEAPHDERFFVRDIPDTYAHETEIHIQRAHAAGYLASVEDYDAVLYLDADTIAINPLDGITWKIASMPDSVLLVTPDPNGETMGKSQCHNGFMDVRDQLKANIHPTINAGTWAGKAQIIRQLVPDWVRIFENEDYASLASPRTKEQAALNKWCLLNPARWLWLSDPSTPLVVFGMAQEKPYSVLRHYMHTSLEHMPVVGI
jgi:hypothetical protein